MEQRAAAILDADVAGYSRLVEAFEQATHTRLRSLRDTVINPALKTARGTVVKHTGDGFLAVFAEPMHAVRFAVAVQDAVRQHELAVPPEQALAMRIGISYGDILLEKADAFGNEVNVAARLQELAEPGTVLVSGSAHERLPASQVQAVDLGLQALKNMSRPVRAFRLAGSADHSRPRPSQLSRERPSIAVLPFRALPSEPALDYLGDGLAEEIVAALASLRELMVISRNSTQRFRDTPGDAMTVSRGLGARYVLSGSLRRSNDRLRIVAELADAVDRAVLWAQRYDFEMQDVFEVQDRITSVIVNTLAPQIRQAEVQRVLQKRPENMTAYDHFLEAVSLMYRLREDDFARAGSAIRRAIALDDSYAPAFALASEWHALRIGQGWSPSPRDDSFEAIRLAEAALDRDPNNALALANLGHQRAYLFRDFDQALSLFDRALAASPGHARAWGLSAPTFNYLGDPEAALSRAQQALTLSPVDPLAFWYRTSICIAHYTAGEYDTAVGAARAALAENPRYTTIWRTLAAALAALGRKDEALTAARRVLELEPGFRAKVYADAYPYHDAVRRERLRRHLVDAGLPD